MSDSAFQSHLYASLTTAQLRAAHVREYNNERAARMLAEILRREAVAAGDMSRATMGERLRAVKAQRLQAA